MLLWLIIWDRLQLDEDIQYINKCIQYYTDSGGGSFISPGSVTSLTSSTTVAGSN